MSIKRSLALRTICAAATLLSASLSAYSAEREVHIVLSFPNGVAWPYFSVASEMGYAKKEGISFKLTSTEGSAASYKALATNQADFAMTQPAQNSQRFGAR